MPTISTSDTLLITGGAGFIGSNFVRYWHQKYPDSTLVILDALTYAGNRDNIADLEQSNSVQFVEGSITDRALVESLVAQVDAVVHFAAESHVDRSITGPSIFVKTNVLGTQVLLDAAKKHGVKRFHHISTDEVFGSLALDGSDKFTLQTPYDPRSPYSASKAGSDHLVRAYGSTFQLPYTITNCSNNYGPYHLPEKLFPLAITNVLEGKKIPLYGNGKHVRDWLHVLDHCRAIEQVLLHGTDGSTYLIGGLDSTTSNKEALMLLCELMNVDPETTIEHVTDRAGHDHRYAIDWSQTEQDLGWKPEISLREGLSQTIRWYQKHQDWWKAAKTKIADWMAGYYAR